MDIEGYISSGKIEECVLGLASDVECSELERLANKYPEIAAEWASVQETMGKFVDAHAVNPPAELRSRVLEAIHFEEMEKQEAPTIPLTPTAAQQTAEKVETKADSETRTASSAISSIPPNERKIPFWPVFSAAASLFLVVSIYLNVHLNGKLGAVQGERDQLLAEKQVIAGNLEKANFELADARNNISLLTNKEFQKVNLGGKDLSPSSSAGIFYNPASGEVRLAATSLPQPPPGKQYQLWALVNGNPIDLGVFDLSSPDHVTRMKQVKEAQAFAVTLEDAGGKAVPTLEQMYLLGLVG